MIHTRLSKINNFRKQKANQVPQISPSPSLSLWESPELVGRQMWRACSWNGTAPSASEKKRGSVTSHDLLTIHLQDPNRSVALKLKSS